jgi:UDP-glucose 4-epimerase
MENNVQYSKDDCFMITGGTGSFGKAIVKRLLATDVGEVRIFSRDEKKQEELRFLHPDPRLKFIIGDVRDADTLARAMPDVKYVFHAAALKQVPSCEFHPLEAIKTNILGAENVMQACVDKSVERCVVLSTDKAVYPINAMGMSKALMEKAMVAKSYVSRKTVFCATRYGNVMASRGSVIPLFLRQIHTNQQVTITDPKMTRFLMSLDDSVELVDYAFNNGRSGDIYVQKQPASTVLELAKALAKIVNKPLDVKEIGTRHGEKVYETLVSREEKVRAKDHGRYFEISRDERNLNYSSYEHKGNVDLSASEDYTSDNGTRLEGDVLVEFLISKLGQEFFNDDRI